jgi:hypothetical protein
MLLKKSVARADDATIESESHAIRINAAPATGFLNQSCAAGHSKSFFNTIDHERFWRRLREKVGSTPETENAQS